jgi:hypothetical protein
MKQKRLLLCFIPYPSSLFLVSTRLSQEYGASMTAFAARAANSGRVTDQEFCP